MKQVIDQTAIRVLFFTAEAQRDAENLDWVNMNRYDLKLGHLKYISSLNFSSAILCDLCASAPLR